MSDIQCGVGRRRESGRREGIEKGSHMGVKVTWGGTKREVAEREVESVKPKGCAVSVENADDPRSLELAKRWCLE